MSKKDDLWPEPDPDEGPEPDPSEHEGRDEPENDSLARRIADPNWQPQAERSNKPTFREIKEEMEALAPSIQLMWQMAIITAAVSLGALIWSFGHRNPSTFQGALMVDVVMVSVLGFGGFMRQEFLARSLVIWVGLLTIIVASFDRPFDIPMRGAWIGFRALMLLAMLRGANAVASFNRLRHSEKRKDVMAKREAIYKMRGPVAVMLAAAAILVYAGEKFSKAVDEPGPPPVVKQKEGVSSGRAVDLEERPDDIRADRPESKETQEPLDRAAARAREYADLVTVAEEAGRKAAAEGDEQACASEGMRRLGECRLASCRSANLVFVETCLAGAKAAPGFCAAIPPPSDREATASWRQLVCLGWRQPIRAAGDPDPEAAPGDPRSAPQAVTCESYYDRFQRHCHRRG